jgi:NhaA family Na+:H+ antiporter
MSVSFPNLAISDTISSLNIVEVVPNDLFNSCIVLRTSLDCIAILPVSLGIFFGVILGKVVGIAGVEWIAVKLGIAQLPEDTTMKQVFGVSFLGGIGFTMSIFVADLAFLGNDALIFQAKVGILAASLISGIVGYTWLRLSD